MDNDSLLADRVLSLSNDIRGEVSQIRAKALLKEVSGEVAQYNWTYNPSRVVRNIAGATFVLTALSQRNLAEFARLDKAAYRFALTWESLAKLGEGVSRETALINAAVSYEMAGYQANAACLARQVGRDFVEIVTPTFTDLVKTFLQRLFVQLRVLSARLRAESKEESNLSGLDQRIASAVSDAFECAGVFFLRGDRGALDKANAAFTRIESFFSTYGAVAEANTARSLLALLPTMQSRSTWEVLSKTAESYPTFKRYLMLLSRGTGNNILRSRSVSEVWPSQITALEGGLLSSSSKIVKMPTSAGKTRVAELAIVYTLVTIPGAKCVYVAPYRALVTELESTLLDMFGDLGFKVSTVLGTYESDSFEQLLVSDADILVTTPEKLGLLQRVQSDFLSNVRLLILDEGQIVNDKSRGVKFELLLTRMKRRLPKARFLFLSAVVPQNTLVDFADWFNASPTKDILVSSWRPSIQRIAKFRWQGETGLVEYEQIGDDPLPERYVPGVIKRQTFGYSNAQTGKLETIKFPEPYDTQTAAELAFKFAELGPVLVFCSQRNFTENVAKAIELRLVLAKLKGEPIPAYFLDKDSTRSSLSAREWLGGHHVVTGALKNGIAVHHGGLPEPVRKAIENDFRERQYRLLVATNTLAQGVNLPIRTVVVHSCRRRSGWKNELIPARDYWNIAGRAGRAGEETEGTVIHLILDRQDEADFNYYLGLREKVEPVFSRLFDYMGSLTRERLTELSTELDPEILALLVEEGGELATVEGTDSVLEGSLLQVQAKRQNTSIKQVAQAFRQTTQNIIKRVPDSSLWQLYSSTGLSTESCELLRTTVLESKERITEMLRSADLTNLDNVVGAILSVCSRLEEMRPRNEFGGRQKELLKHWILGDSITALMNQFGGEAASPERLAAYIADFFAYRLPWGISAFVRVGQKILAIKDQEMSIFIKFLPSMVKYGVPTPEASWAMAAGMPTREIAMKIASRYSSERSSRDYSDFRDWLGKLDSETLRRDFELRSPVLEEVTKTLKRTGLNPLLKKFQKVTDILPHETRVVGIRFDKRSDAAHAARTGQVVDLVREYDNPVDRNAIGVYLSGRQIGYLERPLAQLAAPDMDSGVQLTATILRLEPGDVPEVWISISAATKD